MWQINMAVCVAVGFGCFAWAIKKTLAVEKEKKG